MSIWYVPPYPSFYIANAYPQLNLLCSELLMALGGILDAKWSHEQQVYCGGFCNAQGSLQFIGETSVSLWTLAITLHTLWSVLSNMRHPLRPRFCVGVVLAVWAYVFAFNFGGFRSVSPVDDEDPVNYFAPAPFCECYMYPFHF
jgi:hypothetical protein